MMCRFAFPLAFGRNDFSKQYYADAHIVHRLDMDTSGVMVLARGKANLSALSRQFQERQTQKQYLAWVYGVLQEDTGEVNLPLRCDWPNRPKQIVDHELGKPSLTRFLANWKR